MGNLVAGVEFPNGRLQKFHDESESLSSGMLAPTLDAARVLALGMFGPWFCDESESLSSQIQGPSA